MRGFPRDTGFTFNYFDSDIIMLLFHWAGTIQDVSKGSLPFLILFDQPDAMNDHFMIGMPLNQIDFKCRLKVQSIFLLVET